MLSSSYDDIIVGKNYLAITYALLRMKKNKSGKTLFIDDANVLMGTGWCILGK